MRVLESTHATWSCIRRHFSSYCVLSFPKMLIISYCCTLLQACTLDSQVFFAPIKLFIVSDSPIHSSRHDWLVKVFPDSIGLNALNCHSKQTTKSQKVHFQFPFFIWKLEALGIVLYQKIVGMCSTHNCNCGTTLFFPTERKNESYTFTLKPMAYTKK